MKRAVSDNHSCRKCVFVILDPLRDSLTSLTPPHRMKTDGFQAVAPPQLPRPATPLSEPKRTPFTAQAGLHTDSQF